MNDMIEQYIGLCRKEIREVEWDSDVGIECILPVVMRGVVSFSDDNMAERQSWRQDIVMVETDGAYFISLSIFLSLRKEPVGDINVRCRSLGSRLMTTVL